MLPERTSFSYLIRPSGFAESGKCVTVSSQIMIQSSSSRALSMWLVLAWLKISDNSTECRSYELNTVSSVVSSFTLKRRQPSTNLRLDSLCSALLSLCCPRNTGFTFTPEFNSSLVDELIGDSLAKSVVENCGLDCELFPPGFPPVIVVVWRFSLECWAAVRNDLFFQWFHFVLVIKMEIKKKICQVEGKSRGHQLIDTVMKNHFV